MDPWKTLPNINKTDKRPNYAQIQELIGAQIQKRKIPSGTRLPSEPALIAHFGVSRITVRKAIENLESQGVVLKVHGKGTFVREPEYHGVVDSFLGAEPSINKMDAAIRNGVVNGVVESFIGVEPALNKMGIAVRNEVIYRRDGYAPAWAREVFPKEPVHVICRLKTIKNKKVALEYRVVAKEAARHISTQDLTNKMLTEVLDASPETCTKKASYTVSSRPITQEEADMLDVPLSAPILVRWAVYFNHSDQPMSVGLVVFLADRVKITFDFIRQEPNMKTALII